MSKFVTISQQEDRLRVTVGKETIERLGSKWLKVDLDTMTIHDKGPLSINGKNAVYLHGVLDMDKYEGKYVAMFDGPCCKLEPYTPAKVSDKPYVSITIAGVSQLRFRISKSVMAEMNATHVEADLQRMVLIPFKEADKSPRALKVSERSQFVLSLVENIGKYVGRYKATPDGSIWRLEKVNTHNPVARMELEQKETRRPGYPYAISFPGPMDAW